MHQVQGDKIIETHTGLEVVWRGNAAPYSLGDNPGNPVDYMAKWASHLSEMQKMGLNTMRLTFRFPDSTVGTGRGGDDLDYTKLDQVLAFLSIYNIKGILDCHNYKDMAGDFGSQKLIDDWVALANHCKGYESVAAYELFNEPSSDTWNTTVKSKDDVVTAYRNLTNAVRAVDPDHIVIWESSNYLPDMLTIKDLFLPNTVFTMHRWWSFNKEEIDIYGPKDLSYYIIYYPIDYRQRLNVPFWFGEFGTHGIYDATNPEWLLTQQHLLRCQEQLIGWNLWYGGFYKNPWTYYLPFFPLPSYNQRQPWGWSSPVPNLLDYVVKSNADTLQPNKIEMWHNNDYVTFKPGIIVKVTRTHNVGVPDADGNCPVGTRKSSTGTSCLQDFVEPTNITQETTITNHEGTTDYPGDWNTFVTPIAFIVSEPLPVPIFPWLAAVLNNIHNRLRLLQSYVLSRFTWLTFLD